jgi:sterol desaturase/sphingolipid hydroxylase (fatty acid hydroxylase superfamily)
MPNGLPLALEIGKFAIGFAGVFLLWTGIIYGLHRASHWHHPRNPLWHLHRAHHRHPYLQAESGSAWPRWPQFFLWLGSWRASLDVFVVMTLPAIAIALLWPRYGVPLLVFHYVYEVFCSEYALDHNPKIRGVWTRWFAWGDYHLYHHMKPKRNYSLLITLWDRVFGTAVDPEPGTAAQQQRLHLDRVRFPRVQHGEQST